ncbi:MAG: hypothetical protein RBU25_17145 [Lentisphaeria bacterium]|jgi:hypothetical protein|nr:hypothetical protein [Lentisphaeria bacterium]
MSTSTFRNKNLVRPKKRGAAKRKRVRDQRKRLVGLGLTVEQADKLSYREMRDMLKRPAKIKPAVVE